jgi:hypothetical protein
MTQPNTTTTDQAIAQRRAEMFRRAAAQGVRPLSFDELLGDPEEGDPEKEDVDELVALRREGRAIERARNRA